MKIKFTQSGESPDFGPFKAGDEADLDEHTARILQDRGLAVAADIDVVEAVAVTKGSDVEFGVSYPQLS
jgi:hypothetical protein